MNISFLSGLFIALVVFIGAIISSTSTAKVFFNIHAFFIVIGGTLASSLISFPLSHLLDTSKVLFKKVMGRTGVTAIDLVREFVRLSEGYRNDPQFIANNAKTLNYPFLQEALELLVEGGVSLEEMESILNTRAEVIFLEHEEEAHTFKSMARFPPAFGLLGAVMGMISLMQGLGSPDSFKQIGPAMAMAMVATLYGIALANFVFIPISENLLKLNKSDLLKRNIVIDGIKLLYLKKHPVIVDETLKCYLKPRDRKKTSPIKHREAA